MVSTLLHFTNNANSSFFLNSWVGGVDEKIPQAEARGIQLF